MMQGAVAVEVVRSASRHFLVLAPTYLKWAFLMGAWTVFV